MIWIIISAILTAALSFWFGNRRLFYLYQLTLRKLLFAAVLTIAIYSLLLFLFKIEILSEAVGGAIITNVYASIFGFFSGAAGDQYSLRRKNGNILYSHQSFVSDHLPVIIALSLILFGVYRSALITDLAITPIRVSSGLSFIGIGLWGITLRLVPEFRENGIVLLDQEVSWNDMLTYQWYEENVLEVEYEQNNAIKSFKTLIPDQDHIEVERLLSKKMLEKLEED